MEPLEHCDSFWQLGLDTSAHHTFALLVSSSYAVFTCQDYRLCRSFRKSGTAITEGSDSCGLTFVELRCCTLRISPNQKSTAPGTWFRAPNLMGKTTWVLSLAPNIDHVLWAQRYGTVSPWQAHVTSAPCLRTHVVDLRGIMRPGRTNRLARHHLVWGLRVSVQGLSAWVSMPTKNGHWNHTEDVPKQAVDGSLLWPVLTIWGIGWRTWPTHCFWMYKLKWRTSSPWSPNMSLVLLVFGISKGVGL